MSKLAINGGTPVFKTKAVRPAWPPATPAVIGRIAEMYLSHKWSFYGIYENEFAEKYAKYTGA
ncbi:MAG: DegT/DnrJ/EryC1/StrS family aminotransferase, partial [Lentisphaeria bacterium]|nr:DegT/DnrJ/EryC1/StrS family aminotransferase [Lentisphaeria bacterium]